jgi:tetratricopeptide (TPR) repeat protein
VVVSLHEARVAQRRFAQVRELANTFLFQFYDQVSPLPGSTAVRASIVETARKYLDGLSQEAGGDKDLILELAQAWERLGDVQGAGGANLGQLDDARRSYQRALDLYATLPVVVASPEDLRRRVAGVLLTLGRLEYAANHEDAAESATRRMLDLLADRPPSQKTQMLRAIGERSLGEIRMRQGHSAEAMSLMDSARRTLLELRTSSYADPALAGEIVNTQVRLARAKVFVGDLETAVAIFQDLLGSSAPCDEQAPASAPCRTLAVRLSWTGDVYAAADRPNLNEPDKAAALYERALRIQERITAQDAKDRQARFDLAARYGKLGDAIWRANPTRALDLYERALATATTLVSKEQLEIFRDSYRIAISRPLIQLHRTAEARKALTQSLDASKTDAQSSYQDRLGEIEVRQIWPSLLLAEGKGAEARRSLDELIRDAEALRAGHADDLMPICILADTYRLLASITTGQERREALLHSAAAWHSWPATSFTLREEQKDLAAAR